MATDNVFVVGSTRKWGMHDVFVCLFVGWLVGCVKNGKKNRGYDHHSPKVDSIKLHDFLWPVK